MRGDRYIGLSFILRSEDEGENYEQGRTSKEQLLWGYFSFGADDAFDVSVFWRAEDFWGRFGGSSDWYAVLFGCKANFVEF